MINHTADLEHVEVVNTDALVTAPDFRFRLHCVSPAVELVGGYLRNRHSPGHYRHGAEEQPTYQALIGGWRNMDKPTKTAAELADLIRAEMGKLCPIAYGTMVSVHPDAGTWKVVIVRGGSDHEDFFDIIHLIARRLRTEFDLEG